MISIIVAMSRNRVIGLKSKLPWHLPSDLTHFRQLTMGHPVIMGRKTYESLPNHFRPLPGRSNIVLSRSLNNSSQVLIARSLENALDIAKVEPGHEEVFVIGGASVYEQALPIANRLYLTTVETECEGDAFFPEFELNDWILIEKSDIVQLPGDNWPIVFSTYQKGESQCLR